MIAEGAAQAPASGVVEVRDEGLALAGSKRRARPSGAALLALAIGLLVTAGFAIAAQELYRHNERRLLNLRVRELSLVLSGATQSVQTPLASAAALADATRGDPARFRTLMAPYVGAGRQFASVSLWPLGGGSAVSPRAVLGAAAVPTAQRAAQAGELAAHPGVLNLVGMLSGGRPALGSSIGLATGA